MIACEERDGAIYFAVRVVPRAAQSVVIGEHDSVLRVKLAAPPVEGAANKELIRLLADVFGVPSRAVEITGGHTSKLKRVRVRGASRAALQNLAAVG
ncbi:MAG: DUF167 domain-containing protein [Pyrinomonadaceae bacterium]|nr:DUF167 domain-containing protein [Pyrinomonadaceae bacterium]